LLRIILEIEQTNKDGKKRIRQQCDDIKQIIEIKYLITSFP